MQSTFVGRTEEIATIIDALGDGVVTVVGPGGVGKTATALQVAERFDGDAMVVELTSLPVAHVAAALDAADGLLVIDNAEHVVEAVADWLASHPLVSALVTSRVPLRVPNERVIALKPLPSSDAAALFIDRAARAGASPSDAAAIAALCERLDRLPLAIELAAARARVLSPAVMTERIDDRFRILAKNPNPAQAHHKSLQAAIEWSIDLLAEHERDALQRLTVFADRFDLDQAEHVGVDLDTLDALVSHSLVMSEPSALAPYRLLESVRAFAGQHAPIDESLHGLVTWLDDASGVLDTHDTTRRDALHARLDVVATDVRRAIEHAARAQPPTAVGLFGRLGAWYWDRGRAAEGLSVGHVVAEADPGDDDLATARLLNAIANLAVRAGDPASAVPLYERALDLRVQNDASASQLASTRNDLGACYLHLGELDKAEDSLVAARAGYESVGDRWGVATTTSNLAAVAVTGGHLEGAARAFADAAAEFTHLGDHVQAVAGHTNRGLVLLELADDEAGPALAVAVRAILRAGVRAVLPAALAGAATAAIRHGDGLRAARLWGAATAGGFVDDGELRADIENAIGIDECTRLAAEGSSAADETVLAWAESRLVVSPEPTGLDQATQEAQWRRDGRSWRVTFDGRTATVADRKGMGFIARLLAQPGAEIHAADLMGATTVQRGTELADEAALAAYRHRIAELQHRLDDADARGDDRAGVQAQAELDHLTAELKRATGKGGRARRESDDSERARKAVTNRIRDAVGMVADAHPSLGRHLDKSISTGTFCCYAPERETTWNISA